MIPKIFHQIWINEQNPDLPDQFKRYRDTWLKHHPAWEYRLWNLDNIDFDPLCAGLLRQCRHPAQMADLLRIEIVHRYGGVYIDTDFECLRPIDEILSGVRAFACSEEGKCIATGIIGAEDNSRILKSVIDIFPEEINIYPTNIETGPGLFTRSILGNGFNNDFTLFPSYYFYPFNYHTKDKSSFDLSLSYAVHHYADSWKKPLTRQQKILRYISKKIKR